MITPTNWYEGELGPVETNPKTGTDDGGNCQTSRTVDVGGFETEASLG